MLWFYLSCFGNTLKFVVRVEKVLDRIKIFIHTINVLSLHFNVIIVINKENNKIVLGVLFHVIDSFVLKAILLLDYNNLSSDNGSPGGHNLLIE